MSKEKKRKEKIVYIDDGRTIADMSGISGSRLTSDKRPTSDWKDIGRTYWSAMKMMFRPMLVVIGFLIVVFAIAYLFFWIM